MEWLQSNWVFFAMAVGFIAFHFFGHGGHGSQSHGRDNREPDSAGTSGAKGANDPAPDGLRAHAGHDTAPALSSAKRHRHGC